MSLVHLLSFLGLVWAHQGSQDLSFTTYQLWHHEQGAELWTYLNNHFSPQHILNFKLCIELSRYLS